MDIKKGENYQIFDEITIKARPPIYITPRIEKSFDQKLRCSEIIWHSYGWVEKGCGTKKMVLSGTLLKIAILNFQKNICFFLNVHFSP